MHRRLKELLQSVDVFLQARQRWADSEDQYIGPESDYWQVAEDFIVLWQTGDLPASCRPMLAYVDAIARNWAIYAERAQMDPNGATQPDNGYWRAVDALQAAVEAARQEARKPSRPNIKQLVAEKVPLNQICRMLGTPPFAERVELPSGETRWRVYTDVLAEEIEHPGKHITPDWKSKDEIRYEVESRERAAAASRLLAQADAAYERATTPPVESVEELGAQGVSVAQIARMHSLTADDVRQRLAEAGVEAVESQSLRSAHAPQEPTPDADGQRILDAQLATGRPVREADDAQPFGAGSPDDEEQAAAPAPPEQTAWQSAAADEGLPVQWIFQLHAQGMSNTQIAAEISRGIGKKIHGNKVVSVLKKYAHLRAGAQLQPTS